MKSISQLYWAVFPIILMLVLWIELKGNIEFLIMNTINTIILFIIAIKS